jgi:hypothetical protein
MNNELTQISAGERHEESENPWRRRARAARRTLSLQWCNRQSLMPVAGGIGPDVSLTSYGARIKTVHLAIESIAAGSLLPRRLMLWLDDREAVDHPPRSLRRLQRRGLEIRHAEDLGPHKKYFSYVMNEPLDRALVTADDDVFYPRNWLSGLYQAHLALPDCVHAYRAHVVKVDAKARSFAPYANWVPCTSVEPSHRHFSTGCSGVLFPLPVLEALKRSGRGFLGCCPKADDIWLNLHAVRTQIPVAQVQAQSLRFMGPLLTQRRGLFQQNMFSGGNDRALAATFTEADMQVLLGAQ